MIGCFAADVALGQAQSAATEYAAKSKYLCQLCVYVTWPEEVLLNDQSPFFIGILGINPFGENLRPMEGKKLKGHPIVLRECREVEQAAKCHLVFVSSSEKERLSEVLGRLKHERILTVGEAERFLELGGVVKLIKISGVKKDYYRLEISDSAYKRAKLSLDPQLKDLAKIVP